MTNSPKPHFVTLPAMMFAAGLGMLMYYGHAWWTLPSYTEADIKQSVELNLAMDIQRLGPAASADAQVLERQRVAVRDEVLAEIREEQQQPLNYMGIGAVLLLMGLAHMTILRRMATG